jgi:hypothetical protein
MSSTVNARVVPSSLSSVLLVATNEGRQGLNIMNNSTAVLYLRFDGPAAATNPTVRVPSNFLYEAPLLAGGKPFTGSVYGIWSALDGQAVVTELP